jgi:enterochelin esterase-like enzyme
VGVRSDPFLILTIVLAIALPVGLIWLWPRFAGSGIRSVLARAGLFVLAQAMVVFALLVAVNSYFVFYSSWSDLFGTLHDGGVRIESNSKPQGPQQGAALARTTVPGGSTTTETDGRLESIDIQGLRSGLNERAAVYLPPQYFQTPYAKRGFPVVLDLTASPAQAEQSLPGVVRGEISAKKIQPTLFVMMRPATDDAPDVACNDVPGGKKAATFFASDVPSALGLTYRVADGVRGWGLLGDATGGYCALKLAMTHSDRFGAAASMVAAFQPAAGSYGRSARLAVDQNLVWRLKNLPAPPVATMVPAGAGSAAFVGLVRSPMTVSQATSTALPGYLEWLNRNLSP